VSSECHVRFGDVVLAVNESGTPLLAGCSSFWFLTILRRTRIVLIVFALLGTDKLCTRTGSAAATLLSFSRISDLSPVPTTLVSFGSPFSPADRKNVSVNGGRVWLL